MDRWIVSFITASFFSLLWPTLPSLRILTLLVICATLCLFKPTFRPVSGFLFGCIWMASVGHWQLNWQLPLTELRQVTELEGQITSLITQDENVYFIINARQINQKKQYRIKKVRLAWTQPDWPLKQGQIIRVQVRLKPIHGLANQGGFDYQTWLTSKAIAATGYVKKSSQNKCISDKNSLRQTLSEKINRLGLVNRHWLLALSIGDRSGLTRQDWQLIQHTGIAHLVAISGLHLAIVASFSYFLFTGLTQGAVTLFSLPRQINLYSIGVVFAFFFSCFYAVIAGMELPVVRAITAIGLFTALFVTRRYWRKTQILMMCLFFFVVFFPLSFLSGSFWLSFSAVSALLFISWRASPKRLKPATFHVVSLMIKMQLLLSLLLLPVIAWQFSLVSLISPLVNLLAIPVVTFVLVPACLLGVIGLVTFPSMGEWTFRLTDSLLSLLMPFLSELKAFNMGIFQVEQISGVAWLCVGLFIILQLLPFAVKQRLLLCILLLPFVTQLINPRVKDWQVDILDVGQGLAVLVSRDGHAFLYDTGASYPSGFNMADSVILPVLANKGITHLDMVIISHFDNDHAGSLLQLSQSISIGKLISTKNHCRMGWQQQWQGLHVEALWPDNKTEWRGNDGSCVIRVYNDRYQLLLTGDIEYKAEAALVAGRAESLRSDVLVAPHHGSNTSSSEPFLQAVQPAISVFSEGFMNRWGFPSEKVIRRYLQVGSRLYSTSENGQVSVILPENPHETPQVIRYRQDINGFWYVN